MPNITIRDVPADVHERLTAQAAAEGRSLQSYLQRLLAEASLESVLEPAVDAWLDRMAMLRSRHGRQLQGDDIIALVDETREDLA